MDRASENLGNPLVCICIPVRNGENTLHDTLTSLVNQEYRNFQILICDNLSTDKTKTIIDEFSLISPIKITYLFNSKEGSAEDNWNFLLENLPPEPTYFGIYHADDIYSRNIISKQLNFLKKSNVGAVFTQSRLIDENGRDVTKFYNHSVSLPQEIGAQEIFNFEELLHYTLKYHNLIRTPTFFFRKSILKDHKAYFDKRFKSSADLEFWFRIAKENRIAILNEPLLLYRISKSQGTYEILRNRLEPADYFNVMDHHIKLTEVEKEANNLYEAYRCMDLIFCSMNLVVTENVAKAIRLLNKSLTFRVLPHIFLVPGGIRTYMFGIGLRLSIAFNLHSVLVKIVNRYRKF